MLVTFFRTIVIYFFIILAFKIMGKRQVGELQPSELVITILISNIASLPIEDIHIPILGGIIPIFVLVCMEVFFSFTFLKFPRFREVVTGKPVIVIKDGKIDQKALQEMRFTLQDLFEELRGKDVFDYREIDVAIVETNGNLSIYKKTPYQETTKEDIGADTKITHPSYAIVNDGIVSTEGLKNCNLNEKWLYNILDENNVNLKDIFLLVSDSSANYKIVKKEI